jgi:hypothetical protein
MWKDDFYPRQISWLNISWLCKYTKDVSQLKKPVGVPMEKITVIVLWHILQALGFIKYKDPLCYIRHVVTEHIHNYVTRHVIVYTFKQIYYWWADDTQRADRQDGRMDGWTDGRIDLLTDWLIDSFIHSFIHSFIGLDWIGLDWTGLTQNCTVLHQWNLMGMDSQIMSTYKIVIKEHWYLQFQYLLNLVMHENKETLWQKNKEKLRLTNNTVLI